MRERIKDFVLAWLCFTPFLALLVVGACATLRTSSGSVNWPVILTDAQFGIQAACSQNWLTSADCSIASDAITTTQAVIAKNPSNVKSAVHQTLTDVEATLPTTSKVRDYLDWVIAFSA